MNAIRGEVIKCALVKTGVCLVYRRAITDDLLVGDIPKEVPKQSVENDPTPILSSEPSMQLSVYYDDGNIIESPEKILPCKKSPNEKNSKSIESLPFSKYLQNDVTLHPAVQAGVVDIELTSAFMPEVNGESPEKKQRKSLECSKGRWLTHASEVERLREEKQAQETKEIAKIERQKVMEENDVKRNWIKLKNSAERN